MSQDLTNEERTKVWEYRGLWETGKEGLTLSYKPWINI